MFFDLLNCSLQIYGDACSPDDNVRSVTMQSISNSLKESMNPKDVITDAIHNCKRLFEIKQSFLPIYFCSNHLLELFSSLPPVHPQYSQYEQHFSNQSGQSKGTSLDTSSGSMDHGSGGGGAASNDTKASQKQPINSNRAASNQLSKSSETESTMRNRPTGRNKASEVNLKNAATILSMENEKRVQSLNQTKPGYTEKTTLLSSDDEFQ